MQKCFFKALATLSLLAAGASPATAGDEWGESPAATDPATPSEKKAGKGKDKDKEKDASDAVEVGARIFVRVQRETERIDAGQGPVDTRLFSFRIPDARAAAKVRIRSGVQLVLEADFSSKSPLRDAFIQAKSKHWMVRAGRFKMPLSSFTLESPWTLPRADRGLLEDLLGDHLLMLGRREGVLARFQGGGWWDPAVAIGVFQSILWGESAGDRMPMASPRDLTSVVRISVTPGPTEVAIVGQRRVTQIGEARSFGTLGLDATSEVKGERYALRLWGEGFAGTSWYRADDAFKNPAVTSTSEGVTFFEVRGMVALRRGGGERGEGYGEVFFSGGLLDPDVSVTQDHFLELSAGLNVGHWKKTRLTLEINHGRTARNFPVSYFRDFGLPTLTRHTAAMLQAGAAF
jgi:hypothetical protein